MELKKPSLKRERPTPLAENLGASGAPLDRGHPFYFGFLAAAGGVCAITLLRALASASQVFVLIIISLFLAAGLNPAVEFFRRRGLSRGAAVTSIVGIVLLFVALFAWVVVPPVFHQVTSLYNNAPNLIAELKHNSWIAKLNQNYGIIDSLQTKVTNSVKNGQFVVSAFGGVLGVGKAVVSGAFAALTILILTLYFLASFPSVTKVAYRIIPASRRDRVGSLTDAIVTRVGAFVGGQATAAVISGIFAFILGHALRIPYATALAMLVFVCDLIPLIGHLLGCTTLTLVALTKSPTTAVIALLAYLFYVQIENYVIMPRIMKRSLSLPGVVTIIAALTGTSLLGLVGGILSIPIAAAVLLILDEVVYPKAANS
ncbi:MAG: AI-2E family transporter [Actinomycetes bacterium]